MIVKKIYTLIVFCALFFSSYAEEVEKHITESKAASKALVNLSSDDYVTLVGSSGNLVRDFEAEE
jgi:hypothetical protein